MKKKKMCWFSHNYQDVMGFSLAHIPGKKTQAPKERTIVLLVQCSDCCHTTEMFFKHTSADTADQEVANLNQARGQSVDWSQIKLTLPAVDFI